MIRNLLIRLTGHNPRALGDARDDDLQAMVHLGWAVLVGAAIACVNWGVAAYSLADRQDLYVRIAIAAGAGSIGAALVLIIDRAAIYYLDTHAGAIHRICTFVTFRFGMIAVVGSITATAVMPVYLKSELLEQSQLLREQSDERRSHTLARQIDLSTLQSAVTEAQADADDAHKAVGIVPPEIKARFDDARACQRDYATRRARLINEGVDAVAATARLSSVASHCAQQQANARDLLKAYVERTRAAAAAADDKLQDATSAVDQAKSGLKSKLQAGAAIDGVAINPFSSRVMGSLIATDPGARRKYWTIWAAIMALECLPLMTKLLAARTLVGLRTASDRVVSIAHLNRQQALLLEETEVEHAIRSTMSSAMLEALSNPDIRNQAAEIFAKKLSALVPLETFRVLMREIEANELDVAAAARRHPTCARLITEAWRQTVEEVIALLRDTRPGIGRGAGMRSAA